MGDNIEKSDPRLGYREKPNPRLGYPEQPNLRLGYPEQPNLRLDDFEKLERNNNQLRLELKNERDGVTKLIQKIETLEKNNTLLEIQANEKSLPIRNILFGFVLGFGFTFLVIFVLWFISLYTKPIADIYKEIFCTNLLE